MCHLVPRKVFSEVLIPTWHSLKHLEYSYPRSARQTRGCLFNLACHQEQEDLLICCIHSIPHGWEHLLKDRSLSLSLRSLIPRFVSSSCMSVHLLWFFSEQLFFFWRIYFFSGGCSPLADIFKRSLSSSLPKKINWLGSPYNFPHLFFLVGGILRLVATESQDSLSGPLFKGILQIFLPELCFPSTYTYIPAVLDGFLFHQLHCQIALVFQVHLFLWSVIQNHITLPLLDFPHELKFSFMKFDTPE